MTKYKRIILCENDTGAPVVVTSPIGVSINAGDLVSVNGGTLVVAQVDALMDPESAEYAILSAITVIYEAEAVYHQSWDKEEKKDA